MATLRMPGPVADMWPRPAAISMNAVEITLSNDDEHIVTIWADGRVKFGDGPWTDEAVAAFWRVIGSTIRALCNEMTEPGPRPPSQWSTSGSES